MDKKDKNKINKKKQYSRRDFLKGVSGGAMGTVIAPSLLSKTMDPGQALSEEVPLYSRKRISLNVNGKHFQIMVEPRETLLNVLRERLNMTGPKKICGQGECGGCTVLLEGKPIYSCLYLAIKADGKKISTIEGLASREGLHPVQEAFIQEDGYQCGFCTPGFIMSAAAFLDKKIDPSPEEIRTALSGNLCRCGNYSKIFNAVSAAAETIRRS